MAHFETSATSRLEARVETRAGPALRINATRHSTALDVIVIGGLDEARARSIADAINGKGGDDRTVLGALNRENARLTAENDDLRAENKRLLAANVSLRDDNERLKAETVTLSGRASGYSMELDDMTRIVRDFVSELHEMGKI